MLLFTRRCDNLKQRKQMMGEFSMTGQTGNMVLLQIKETYESLSNSEKQVAGVQPGDSKGVIWALLLIVL